MLKNARKLNPQLKYRKGDMRTVRLKEQFDAIMLHDSVNYMLTRSDPKKVFCTAYVHLKPGGVLWTRIEEYNRIQQNRLKFSTRKEKISKLCLLSTTMTPTRGNLSGYIYLSYRKNKRLEICTDRHIRGIFKLATWFLVIRKAGFKVKQQRFEHSTIPKIKDMPELICLKPKCYTG